MPISPDEPAATPVPGSGGAAGKSPIVAELTEREASLLRANRALRTVCSFLQVVVRADSESSLLNDVCRVVVTHGGYRLAWVGLARDDPEMTVRPVAAAGIDDGYVGGAEISWADEPRGQGPTGRAIRSRRPVVCRDLHLDPDFAPWRDEALKRGFATSISLPLLTGTTVLGALSIYAAEPDAFDGENVGLLTEMADSLTQGIASMRAREEQTRIIEAERQYEARFHQIVEASPNGLCVVNAEGTIVLVNSRMEELFGYRSDELIGHPVELLVPGAEKRAHSRRRAEFQANPSVRRMGDGPSFPARRKDGTEFPVDISLHPIAMPEGAMVLATITDISERVKAEEARRHKEALFNELVRTIPDKIYVKDRQSRFVQVNDSMAIHCGLRNTAEAVGRTDFDFFSNEHARRSYGDEQRVMSTGEPLIGLEEKETWSDGRVTWLSTTKVPLRDERGRITGLVGVSRDITEKKNLAAQLLQSHKMEAFGQLAGGVAHDFNNILAAMFMELDLAQRESALPATIGGKLQNLQQLAGRAAGLTRQLLMFSRRQEPETRTLDLNAVLEGIYKMLRRLIGEDVAFELKAASAPLWIEADSGMIEQVVMNLCINARDAMPNGGRLVVEASMEAGGESAAHTGRFACLTVKDTGCGMDAATRARVFEPFFTTKPIGKGSGLGLATVYGILQQHRGWVEVESEPGNGSTFRCYFPLKEVRVAAANAAHLPAAPGGSESVLLVEDDALVRAPVAQALRRAGYAVTEAADGADAVRKWNGRTRNFDLLLTDFLMPGGLNGGKLAEYLLKMDESLAVVIMSGYATLEDTSATHLPDRTLRLAKPFSMQTLLETVRRCLNERRSQNRPTAPRPDPG